MTNRDKLRCRMWAVFRVSSGLLVLALVILLLWPVSRRFPGFEEVRRGHTQSEAILLDRHGEIIHELRVDSHTRRLDWVRLEDVSPALQSTLIHAEDKRFFEHHGVDWISVLGALAGSFRRPGPRGASTITMQVAAKLDEDLRPRTARRSLLQKFNQVQGARALERQWSKRQILEAYLNLVSFRGELRGLSAASRGLFRKEPQGLTDVESLILSALVRSPNAPLDQLVARACILSDSMGLPMQHDQIGAKARETLSHPYLVEPRAALAPHVAQRLRIQFKTRIGHEPGTMVSTLDGKLQYFAAEALLRHILSVRSRNVRDGALLVVENRSGDVLAYVGNTGEQSSARYVDGVQAARQAGSTLKPFIYALAFANRYLTPASLIDDSPLDIPVLGGAYRPHNYDDRFHGMVTARSALASSLNVPAVKTLNLVGVESFVEQLRVLGFRNVAPADYYGPSLALGSIDVALWDLVNAYRTVANSGIRSELHIGPDEPLPAGRRVMSAEAAFLISDVLSDRESRSRTFTLESPLSTRFWTAVKTGTSKDMRDNWCVGFSSRYTVGVWVGNFSGDPMWDVSGITGAAPVWVEIMEWLHRNSASNAPRAPAGIVSRQVAIAAAGQVRREWFIRGTETSSVEPAPNPPLFRIAYPTQGTVVALDPDIPPEAQKLFFEAEPGGASLAWILDGEAVGSAGAIVLWTPKRGKHVLSLVDQSGKVVDSVNFEVRG